MPHLHLADGRLTHLGRNVCEEAAEVDPGGASGTIRVLARRRLPIQSSRVCDPESKLGVLRWVQTVALPDVEVTELTHQQLLRSMDALMDNQDAVDGVIASLLRPLVDQDLLVAFYDMTKIRAEGLATVAGDVRQFGMAKEGLITRQFMLGVVQTSEGLQRFPHLRRLVLVADRGLLSLDNLEALQAIHLNPAKGHGASQGQALEFIIAVPGRRYIEFAELLEDFQLKCAQSGTETTGEIAWNGLRLVVAHDPVVALEQHQKRRAKVSVRSEAFFSVR